MRSYVQRDSALKRCIDYRLSVIRYAPGNSDGQIISLVQVLGLSSGRKILFGMFESIPNKVVVNNY